MPCSPHCRNMCTCGDGEHACLSKLWAKQPGPWLSGQLRHSEVGGPVCRYQREDVVLLHDEQPHESCLPTKVRPCQARWPASARFWHTGTRSVSMPISLRSHGGALPDRSWSSAASSSQQASWLLVSNRHTNPQGCTMYCAAGPPPYSRTQRSTALLTAAQESESRALSRKAST